MTCISYVKELTNAKSAAINEQPALYVLSIIEKLLKKYAWWEDDFFFLKNINLIFIVITGQ
jgi:hypothetical protein